MKLAKLAKDDGEVVRAVRERDFYLGNLFLETTRRCNLLCPDCYKDEAEPVDVYEGVLETAVETFPRIGVVGVLGGESTLNAEGMCRLLDALKYNKTLFEKFLVVINGTRFPREYFEILDAIGALRGNQLGTKVRVSNDERHDKAFKRRGFDKMWTAEKISECEKKYKHVEIHYPRLEVAPIKQSTENMKFLKERRTPFSRGVTLDNFTVDAKGNVTGKAVTYRGGDQSNFGNVLREPVPDILLNQSHVI